MLTRYLEKYSTLIDPNVGRLSKMRQPNLIHRFEIKYNPNSKNEISPNIK